MTDTWAAKVLAGVPRYNPGGCGNSVWLHVDDALAAIAKLAEWDGLVERAIAELQDVVHCRCSEAYTERGLRDPNCQCDSQNAVHVVAAHIAPLTDGAADE